MAEGIGHYRDSTIYSSCQSMHHRIFLNAIHLKVKVGGKKGGRKGIHIGKVSQEAVYNVQYNMRMIKIVYTGVSRADSSRYAKGQVVSGVYSSISQVEG